MNERNTRIKESRFGTHKGENNDKSISRLFAHDNGCGFFRDDLKRTDLAQHKFPGYLNQKLWPGLKYVLIPMDGVSAPTDEQVAQFLQIANDPATGKFYVHCKAGIHRTGAMGAAYRISHDGWDYNKAYTEMKNYQFSAGLFHGALKTFVEKYAAKNVAQKSATVAMKTAAATSN